MAQVICKSVFYQRGKAPPRRGSEQAHTDCRWLQALLLPGRRRRVGCESDEVDHGEDAPAAIDDLQRVHVDALAGSFLFDDRLADSFLRVSPRSGEIAELDPDPVGNDRSLLHSDVKEIAGNGIRRVRLSAGLHGRMAARSERDRGTISMLMVETELPDLENRLWSAADQLWANTGLSPRSSQRRSSA